MGRHRENPRLSILIVNWNTRDLLSRCLESVVGPDSHRSVSGDRGDASGEQFEVIVVDNASADGSARMVQDRFPDVRLIENRENVGFARANNQAFLECAGPYVLLLNPDTEVQPGALETLVRFMDEHPEAGAAGARLVGVDGTLQPSCHPAPTLSREAWRLAHLDACWPYACYPMHRWNQAQAREVDVVQGACLVLRRDALNQGGLLDEDYFIYSEEVDLCHRLRRFGWRIFWVPSAVVMHLGAQSTRQVAAAMFLRLYQGKILYFRKNHGPASARTYKLILLVFALARLALSPLAAIVGSNERYQYQLIGAHYRSLLAALPTL